MTFVIVDKTAIYENDKDGGDRPPIAVYQGCSCKAPLTGHDVWIQTADGQIVGRFRSQSTGRKVDRDRPHVWFELEPGVRAVPVTYLP